MTKQELRIHMKKVRQNINVNNSSDLLMNSNILNGNTVGIFYSYNNEIDTHLIIEELLRRGKIVCIPRVDKNDMTFHRFENTSSLVKNKMGILESTSELINKDSIDLMIIPGLAFTKDGKRLGYGGGFYDRYLRDFKGLKIGYCYEEQVCDEVPIDSYDIQMDVVVTNKTIYKK